MQDPQQLNRPLIFVSQSVADTHRLASGIARLLPGGSVLGLTGPLGAGKTEFVRGFARALGVREDICSPTFVLEAQYDIPPAADRSARMKGPVTLHHWDLYRITAAGSDFECEIADLAGDYAALTIVEWPERVDWVQRLLTASVVISLPEFSIDGETADYQRTFSISPHGSFSVAGSDTTSLSTRLGELLTELNSRSAD